MLLTLVILTCLFVAGVIARAVIRINQQSKQWSKFDE